MPSPFDRLRDLVDPDAPLTPQTWRLAQPCRDIRVGSRTLVLSQPSSSFWVYLLGLLTVAVGVECLWDAGDDVVLRWWGVGLVLWGVGAVVAGTSYQAFGFHIKCSGRAVCSWTSWWEIAYLVLQQASLCALLVAVAHQSASGWVRRGLVAYAAATALVYAASVLLGALRPVRSWITFERMILFSAPVFVLLVATSAHGWLAGGHPVDALLLGAWAGLLVCIAAFFVYEAARIGPRLWKQGRGPWFSENDVLHVTLIAWVVFLREMVVPALGGMPPGP